MNVVRAVAVATAALCLSSCADDGSPSDTRAPARAPAVELSPASLGSSACVGAEMVSNRPDHAAFCTQPE